MYEILAKAGFGTVTLGDGLGFMYGDESIIPNVPAGWLFINNQEAKTPEEIKNQVEEYKSKIN